MGLGEEEQRHRGSGTWSSLGCQPGTKDLVGKAGSNKSRSQQSRKAGGNEDRRFEVRRETEIDTPCPSHKPGAGRMPRCWGNRCLKHTASEY